MLDHSFFDSSLWGDHDASRVFLWCLRAMKPFTFDHELQEISVRSLDRGSLTLPPGTYGFVEAASSGLARAAALSKEATLSALERLASEDLESRSAEFGGRRLIRVAGGFVVLNSEKYRRKDHTANARKQKERNLKKSEAAHTSRVTSRLSHRDVTLPFNVNVNVPVALESPSHASAENSDLLYARGISESVERSGEPLALPEPDSRHETAPVFDDTSRNKLSPHPMYLRALKAFQRHNDALGRHMQGAGKFRADLESFGIYVSKAEPRDNARDSYMDAAFRRFRASEWARSANFPPSAFFKDPTPYCSDPPAPKEGLKPGKKDKPPSSVPVTHANKTHDKDGVPIPPEWEAADRNNAYLLGVAHVMESVTSRAKGRASG